MFFLFCAIFFLYNLFISLRSVRQDHTSLPICDVMMSKITDPYKPLNRLKVSGNLPVIPQILVQLIDACHQPEVDLQAVSKLVAKDAALAAKVLQLCNSAFIGARSTFTDIQQATIYLGANTIKNLAISVSVQQVFRRVEANGLLNIDRFWYHSYQNAILARRIAELISYPNPSEAYLAGLLHDIGKLLLWMAFPGKYAPLLLKGVRCHNGRLAFLEQEKLHINHCEAGAWLIEQWGLPSLICDSIRYHHHPVDEVQQGLPLTRIVYLSDLISHSDNPEQECNEVADQLFRLAPGQTEKLQEGVEEQIQEVAHKLGIRIPKHSSSTLEPEPESETIHRETSAGLINRIRDITQLSGFLDNILQAKDLEQIARVLEQSLKILFNQEKCIFLLFEQAKNQLRGFTSPDNELLREAASLQIDLDHHKKSLPACAFELHQLLHSFMKRPDNENILLDEQLARMLKSEGLVVVPMNYQQKPVGLIVIGASTESHRSLLSHSTPLQLLGSQAAVSLHICQWKEQQAERIASERLNAASGVARKIAHEINNPLAILRNYFNILRLKLPDQAEAREELTIIDAEFERIGRITDQLRDIATVHQQPRLQKADLNQVIEDILTLYRAGQLSDGAISLEFLPGRGIPILDLDINSLKQIMTNLINNAIEALNGRGSITITTTAPESQGNKREVVLTIEDTGPGVADEVKETLFQAGTSTKGGGHGGLGLAIVSKLVRELGGSITLAPTDTGASFQLSLPTQTP